LTTYKITIADSNLSFPCKSDESVLASMISFRNGPVTHGCCGGGCGVCRMKVIEGKYEKFKKMSRAHLSETDETDNIVLLCCIQPRSNLLISKGEKNGI